MSHWRICCLSQNNDPEMSHTLGVIFLNSHTHTNTHTRAMAWGDMVVHHFIVSSTGLKYQENLWWCISCFLAPEALTGQLLFTQMSLCLTSSQEKTTSSTSKSTPTSTASVPSSSWPRASTPSWWRSSPSTIRRRPSTRSFRSNTDCGAPVYPARLTIKEIRESTSLLLVKLFFVHRRR